MTRPLIQGSDEHASERAGVGAAMIAGIGAGVFKGYEGARKLAPRVYRGYGAKARGLRPLRISLPAVRRRLPSAEGLVLIPFHYARSHLYRLANAKYAVGAYNINSLEQIPLLFDEYKKFIPA